MSLPGVVAPEFDFPSLDILVGEAQAGERNRHFHLKTGIGNLSGRFPDEIIAAILAVS